MLEPEILIKAMRMTRSYFPETDIYVTTNGSLIPKMDDVFWECVKENNILIGISVYPPLENEFDHYIEMIKEKGLRYMAFSKRSMFQKFLTLEKDCLDERNIKEEAEKHYKDCINTGCHVLRDGYIAHCPEELFINSMAPSLGIDKGKLESDELIPINIETDGWDILKKLESACKSCVRCDYKNRVRVEWKQCKGKPDPKDWLLEG